MDADLLSKLYAECERCDFVIFNATVDEAIKFTSLVGEPMYREDENKIHKWYIAKSDKVELIAFLKQEVEE